MLSSILKITRRFRTGSVMAQQVPDLADLNRALLGKAVVRLLLGRLGSSGSPRKNLATSVLRLTDKAIHEYKLGRKSLVQYKSNRQNFLAFFRAQGHFENCLQSLHHCLRFVDALRRHGPRQPSGAQALPKANQVEVLSSGVSTRLKVVRHGIEHIDDRICDGDIQLGQPIALHLTDGGLQLEGTNITYAELARWLRQLYRIADAIAEVGFSGTPSNKAPEATPPIKMRRRSRSARRR